MSESKNRKLKRLRKKHIWPSVVGLMIFGLISFLIIFSNMSTLIAYFVMTDMINDFDRAQSLATVCANEYAKSKSWEQAAECIMVGSGTDASAAIIDGEGNFVAGYGKPTFDASRSFRENISESFGEKAYVELSLMLDTENGDSVFEGIENDDVDFGEIVSRAAAQGFIIGSSDENVSNIFTYYYWIGFPIEGTDNRLLVRDDIVLRNRDIIMVMTICIIVGGLLIIPCIFLLANVIRDVVSIGKVRKLIYTDPVTGGHNWLYLEHNCGIIKKLRPKTNGKAASEQPAPAKRLENRPAMVNFTMRKYRSYCSCHGVAEGEALLERIDVLLKSHLRKNEISAHYSEAEFALVLIGKTPEEIQQRVHDITAKITTALGHAHLIFHSGIYFADGGENDIAADAAQMYNYAASAKNSIRECENSASALFNKELLNQQLWEHRVEACMDEALANEEFEVYLQPKYEPTTGTLRGAEALIRWISPTDGFVSPGRFIPIFERNGFITKIDDYMISHVAAQQAKWISEGKDVVPVSVNVSRAHFTQADLAEHIRDLVDAYGVPHSVIEIELTESAFFDDKGALLSTVNKLKAYGFEISMDDFGAGYSSLNSLKDLPLDVLKLDAEFFRGNNSGNRGEVVVSEAIKLAKSLDMRIVAEGVEKKEQVDFLAKHGCDMIQGFYFAKPMPIPDFEQKHWSGSNADGGSVFEAAAR
ncbi:MAG: EAL domain-containing protein [Oscillospiraceae bacterium]|nr:EAL domain-containing protein [Oscillospiraceae bacterium]